MGKRAAKGQQKSVETSSVSSPPHGPHGTFDRSKYYEVVDGEQLRFSSVYQHLCEQFVDVYYRDTGLVLLCWEVSR